MPSLKTLSGRQIRAILESNGFVFVSQKGSHLKLKMAVEDASGAVMTFTVIVPDHKDVPLARYKISFARADWGAAHLKREACKLGAALTPNATPTLFSHPRRARLKSRHRVLPRRSGP